METPMSGDAADAIDFDAARARMVEHQIRARGVTDPRILDAMRDTPREAFVPAPLRAFACDDRALPISEGQTISQPYVVAFMLDALDLQADDHVLEVGAGSGYAAAVLGRLVARVDAVERHDSLATEAAMRLRRLGVDNVRIVCGDGAVGLPGCAPFDAILVSAGGREIPAALRDQLRVGGRMVIPVGRRWSQRLVRIRRVGADRFEEDRLGRVRFVPLVTAPSRR